MSKERFLTIMVPIKDADCVSGSYTVQTLPTPNVANINKIYKMSDGTYRRLWYNTANNNALEYHAVTDREFPYLGNPMEIHDFTYDATRMGQAPSISAQNVMWYADYDSQTGVYTTLEGLWKTNECFVEFNGERFYLKQIPTSSKSNEDARYKYDIDFVSERVVLEQLFLYDVVSPFVTEKPISENSTFSFFGDATELAKRINASLIRSGLATLTRKYEPYPTTIGTEVPYLTYEQWNTVGVNPQQLVEDGVFADDNEAQLFRVRVYGALKADYNQYLMTYIFINDNGVYEVNGYQCEIGKDKYGNPITTEEKLITFDKNTIYDALQEFHNTFELQYYIAKEKDGNGQFTGNTQIWVADCEKDFADWDETEQDYVRDDDGVPTTEDPLDYPADADAYDEGNAGGLIFKEKANTTDKIITRITGVGSEQNIPWYYPNPNPDGWIKPTLKTLGEAQQIVIDYPTSEGDTVAENVRYEKYLKNRIGNNFTWGVIKETQRAYDYRSVFDTFKSGNDIVGFELLYFLRTREFLLLLEEPDDWATNYSNYYYYEDGVYHPVEAYTDWEEDTYYEKKTTVDVPKLTLDLSIMSEQESNFTHFTAKRLSTGDVAIESFDSSNPPSEPTEFQTMCLNHNGENYIQQPNPQGFKLSLGFYFSALPTSQNYQYKGYRYPALTIHSADIFHDYWDHTNHERHVYVFQDTAYLGENFYSKNDLTPYVVWDESVRWEGGVTVDGVYYKLMNHRIYGAISAGYSTAPQSQYGTAAAATQAVSPLTRVKDGQYIDENGVVWVCTSSSQANPDTGANQSVFRANPQMSIQEWLETFVNLKLRLYDADSWYLGNKVIDLADYGINSLTQGGSDYEPDIFDAIEFSRVKYITPQPNLMPEVYIKTDGERRFYNAHDYYPLQLAPASGVDTAIGEVEITSGADTGKVRNNIYKENETDPDNKHYDFENEYVQTQPHEHIEDFDDVKPTIKGQLNLVNGQQIRIDVVETFGYDLTDNDEIWESNDNGNIQGEYKHPYFFAKLRPLGFNLFDLALQDDMVLSMTTGHCGACNFKIAVDENTKKNTVQIWEYNVYGGDTFATKGDMLYAAGDLRRYVDDSNLYYDTDGTEAGYKPVNSYIKDGTMGFLVDYPSTTRVYKRYNFSAQDVEKGLVGSLKQDAVVHFEGDVMTSGRFIADLQDTSEKYVWVALTKDVDTYGVLMPSARPDYDTGNYSVYIRPQAVSDVHTSESTPSQDEEKADKFVLINIKLPQVYLRRAERELSRKLVEYMYKNNYQKFNTSLKFSRIYFEDNPETTDGINENSVLYVRFNNRIYRQYVKHYTYRMTSEDALPEVNVDMNEELPVTMTTAQRQNRSRRIANKQLQSSMTIIDRQIRSNTARIDQGTTIIQEQEEQKGRSDSGDSSQIFEQVQTDWSQTDDAATDYIKNKPTYQVASGKKIYYNGQDVTDAAELQQYVAAASSHWHGSQADYDDLVTNNLIQAGVAYYIETQPDWAQSDSTKLDYIKNKPTLPYVVIAEKTFDPYTITAAGKDNGYIFFLNVVPTSDNYYEPWKIKYRLSITTETQYIQGIYDCEMGSAGTSQQYSIFNRFYSTSYYPSYYHLMACHSTAAKYANRSTNPIKIGERIWSAASATTVARTFTIQVIETKNCTVSFPDDIETYGDVYTDAKYGYCTEFNATSVGLQATGDTNYENNYEYLAHQSYKIHSAETPLYRYKYCGFDDKNRLVPITNTNQTNATIVTKTPTSVPMVVSKGLVFYNSSNAITDITVNASTSTLYTNTSVSQPLSYNFNTAISANTDVYLVGDYDPETDLFTLDSTSTNSYYLYASNADPTTYLSNFTSGKYYWLLGNTTGSYINFLIDNPLMYFDGTNLISADAVSYNTLKDYVDAQIGALPNPMIFKGTVGTGGTIEWADLPSASSSNEGWTYKVITAHATTPICDVGDTIISNGSEWTVIPSGDEPSGTVTNITAGAGLNTTSDDTATDGGTITESGTLYLTKSGVTAANYGPSSNPSPGFGGTFNVPYIAVDKYGRVTSASNRTVTVPGFVKSDWTQETSSDNSYILNRPDVRTGVGSRSLKLNDINNNIADGQYSTAEGESTRAYGDGSHVEGIGVQGLDKSFSIISFVDTSTGTFGAFETGNFDGAVGDTIVFTSDTIEREVTNIVSRSSISVFFTPPIVSIKPPKYLGGVILSDIESSGAYGDASHAEGSGTTAWGTSSHAEGSSDVTFSENDITVSFIDVDTGELSDHHDYLPVAGDRFEYNDVWYTVYINKPDVGEGEFHFYPSFDTAPSGAQTITVYHFDSGAIGENSHVEGLNTIALNDNEHAEGRYNISTVDESSDLSTLHSIGIGDGNAYRKNAVEVNGHGDVYIRGVGGYNGKNMNESGVSDLATVIGTIPSPANSGKMKISANNGSAVNTLFNANSSSDTNAIKFINGTNTQVTVTAASGSTPATVKYDFTGTIPAAQIQSDWTQTNNASLDYIKNKPAVNTGTGANSVIEGTTTVAANDNEHAEGVYNKSNTKSDGTTDENKAGTTLSSIGIGSSNNARENAIEVMQSGDVYITGVGGYDGTNPNATGIRTIQDILNDTPLMTKDYTYTGANNKANGYLYFMQVHPQSESYYDRWYVRYKLFVEKTGSDDASEDDIIETEKCRGYYDCYFSQQGETLIYSTFNEYDGATPIYHHNILWQNTQALWNARGYDSTTGLSTYPVYIGCIIRYATAPTKERHYHIDVYEYKNCKIVFPDVMQHYSGNVTIGGVVYPGVYNSSAHFTSTITIDKGLYESGDVDTTNITDILLYYSPLKAGTTGIQQYSLVMQDSTGAWQSFTTTGGIGTAANPNNKTPNISTNFRAGSPVYIMNSSSAIAADSYTANNTICVNFPRADFRYDLNIYNAANVGLTDKLPVYIKGTIDSNGYFHVDSTLNSQTNVYSPWWTQSPNETTDGEGRVYIKVCESVCPDTANSTANYRGDLISSGEMWHFDTNGVFCRYYPGTCEEGSYLPLAGGTMSGDINMSYGKITNVHIGGADNDVVVCKQTLIKDESDNFNAHSCKIVRLDEPTNNDDAATKNYVDTTIATAIQGINLNPSVCFTTIRAIDGSKNMNIAVMHYTTGHEPALLFDTPMQPNTVCHIITYRTGDTDYPSSSAGAFEIPKDICVGGQDSDTHFASSRNYVWINGTLVNGGSVDGSSDTVAFETSALGTREIDIFYSKQEDVSGQEDTYWYQTFIKVDQD